MESFIDRIKKPESMIYDGGFGSQLFARGIELANSAVANDEHPDAVIDIHRAYIEAGADAIGTNTFVASELHLEMAKRSPSDAGNLAKKAANLARVAADSTDRNIYVGGSVGPSPGAIESDAGDTTFGIADTLVRDAHTRIIEALATGGVDFICIETQFSAKEAAIACDIARRTGLPIAINLTFKYTRDRKTDEIVYKTDWGHSPSDLLDILASGTFSNGENLLEHVQVFGLNCGAETRHDEHTGMAYAICGAQQLKVAMETHQINRRIMAYPNAGMPKLDKQHQTFYSQTPTDMASELTKLIDNGGYFIGGCCGTTPEHIRAFRDILDNQISNRDSEK
ncbi:MAG: homocysteine S-methyltransferase family protein [Candidatus Latescibacterota bacterium]|nr:homocysteine S-methyltransferase family protein [Candidatus Latescibacterota bacterium]